MPDVLPIRASEEMQARFREFTTAGDFRTQTDFFNHLLTLYAAQETGVRVPTLEGAITSVNELTDRINKILIGAGETISANQEKENAKIESIQHEAAERITKLTAINEELNVALEKQKELTEKIKKELADARENEKKLEQTLNDKVALIDGYREKITGMETEISQQRIIVTEAKNDKTELETLRSKTKEQDLQIEHMTLEKDKALHDQKTLYTKKMNETVTAYDTTIAQKEIEIEHIKNSNDKALITLETKLRKEITDLQTQYGKTINGYETKVFSLLQELENTKNTRKTESAKNGKAPE